MITNLLIKNFRGIEQGSISDIGQVNLLFGKNNCGKSSLLDAIFMISGVSNPGLALDINSIRAYNYISEDDLSLNFYRMDTKEPIIIETLGPSMHRILHINKKESHIVLLPSEQLQQGVPSNQINHYGLDFKAMVEDVNVISSLEIEQPIMSEMQAAVSPKIKMDRDSSYIEKINANYIPSNYNFQNVSNKFREIVENKQQQFIIDILKQFDSRIIDIQMVANKIMVDVGFPKLLPINLMGDGIRKIFSLLVLMYISRDGIILIDEIDNGFHYSAMRQLWSAILISAKEFNTQVFATTHNEDSIRGLVQSVSNQDISQNLISAYKIINKDSHIESVRYSIEQLEYALQQNLEMR